MSMVGVLRRGRWWVVVWVLGVVLGLVGSALGVQGARADVGGGVYAPAVDATPWAGFLGGPYASGGNSAAASGISRGPCDSSAVEQFDDVEPNDYGAEYILCMRPVGLSTGVGDGNYGPDRELKRGQMASFLVRLWRDVLGRACPGGEAPFTDVPAGGVHAANIACLYNLGITKGQTATTYEPGSNLTASQISRFLFRLYEKAGNTCDSRDSELEEAIDCLLDLHVIPSRSEGTSNDTVTRSQMAVYSIGLWHNLAGRGLPPLPPERPTLPSEFIYYRFDVRDWVAKGTFNVTVFYCAREGKYTVEDLAAVVDDLNRELSPRWSYESSGMVNLVFIRGDILTTDVSMYDTDDLYEKIGMCRRGLSSNQKKIDAITGRHPSTAGISYGPDTGYYLLLIDGIERTDPAGVATGLMAAVDYTYYDHSPYTLYPITSHELGHSLLKLPHSWVCATGNLAHGTLSHGNLMCSSRGSLGYVVGTIVGRQSELDQGITLACYFREARGWPHGPDRPPCIRLAPSPPPASFVVQGEQLTMSWWPPAFTDDVPVTHYTASVAYWRWEDGDAIGEPQWLPLVTLSSDERSYSFDLDALSDRQPGQILLSLSAHSQYGEGVNAFDLPDGFFFVPSPESVWASELTSNGFELSWSPVPGAVNYQVWDSGEHPPDIRTVDDLGNVSERRISTAVEDGTSLQRGPREPGAYTFRVRACGFADLFGREECSAGKVVELSVRFRERDVETAGSLPLLFYDVADDYVRLGWRAKDIQFHECSYPIGSNEWGSFRPEWPGSDCYFSSGLWEAPDLTVAPNKTYTFRIRPCGKDSTSPCQGDWSTATVTTKSLSPAPASYPVSVKEVGDTWFTLAWDPPFTDSFYELRVWNPTMGGWYVTEGSSARLYEHAYSEIATEHTHQQLTPGTDYVLKLRTCRPASSHVESDFPWIGLFPNICDDWVTLNVSTLTST